MKVANECLSSLSIGYSRMAVQSAVNQGSQVSSLKIFNLFIKNDERLPTITHIGVWGKS